LQNTIKILLVILTVIIQVLGQGHQSSGKDTVIIDEIVVESNRLKMTNVLAPNKIQVLNEALILSLNGSKLPDALTLGDGVFIKDYGFNSGIKTISLNSTQSEHTVILINGIRLNSRQNAQVDLSLYGLDNISKIEISKGGSSALYGSESIGGVVNIVTGDFNSSKPVGIQLKTELGSYGLKKFYGRFSQKLNLGINKYIVFNISGSDERANNNYKYYFKNGLTQVLKERENSDFNIQNLNFDINFILGNLTFLKLFTYYSHFDRGFPGIELGYSPGTARQIDYNSISSVSFSRPLSKNVAFNTDISYKYSLQKYFDPSTFNLSVKINSFYKLNSYTNASSFTFTPVNNFSTETGYEISYNNITSNETEEGKLIQGALFAIAKYELSSKIISKITLYPSIRYDYFSNIQQKNVITGKFGINLKPFDNTDLHFKSTIGNNFSAPTFNELYWKDLGNKDLKPERSISFDAGIFYKFNFLLRNELEVSYYNINTTDRIVWTPISGSIWHPVNIGKVKSEGIDVSLRTALVSARSFNLLLNFNYTYGIALKKNEDFTGDPSFNKQLIYQPNEMIKSSLMMNYLPTSKLLKYVSFNMFYRFTARSYTNFENTQFVPRFDILDGNVGFGVPVFNTELRVKFIANNILNENYQIISGFPMPLRNFKLEFSIKY
jgi:outer membrane cobalamin receptor